MIPITKPTLPPYERFEHEIRDVFTSGVITSSKYVQRFEAAAARYLGVSHAITVPSCTAGLTVVMSTLPENTEVIMPAYTFSATYEAARWNGLTPVLVDCDDSCNIDVSLIESAITPRTSAIVAVHMYGTPPNIVELERIAAKHRLKLFFDGAHAFGSRYKGQSVGGFGDAEVFSLGPTKTMPVGEGGLITTNDAALAARVRLACTHGHGPESLDCEVKGINGRLEEVNGVVGFHVLADLDRNVDRRNELATLYKEKLSALPGVSFPAVPADVRTTYKDFCIFVSPAEFGMDRDQLGVALRADGVATRTYFYPPVHWLTICRETYRDLRLPKTERLSSSVLALPMYSHLPFDDVLRVCDAVRKAHATAGGVRHAARVEPQPGVVA